MIGRCAIPGMPGMFFVALISSCSQIFLPAKVANMSGKWISAFDHEGMSWPLPWMLGHDPQPVTSNICFLNSKLKCDGWRVEGWYVSECLPLQNVPTRRSPLLKHCLDIFDTGCASSRCCPSSQSAWDQGEILSTSIFMCSRKWMTSNRTHKQCWVRVMNTF